MISKKFFAAAAICAGAALGLTACSPAGGAGGNDAVEVDTSSLEALIEAAKAEGQVSIYGELQEPDMDRFAKGFTEKYGIKASTIRLGGNSLAQRFDAEITSGSPTADILLGVDLEFFNDFVQKGHLASFDDSGVHGLLEGFSAEYSLEGFGVPLLQTLSSGYIYNTDIVSESDIPKTWNELVESPRWNGKYCSVDPTTSASVMQFFSVVRAETSDELITEFGETVGRWYPNIVAMNEAVAVGECDLGVNSAQFFVEGMKGADAPVEFALAPDTIYPTPTTAVATAAVNPNAARLFMHYILSEEGNALLNNPAGGSFGPWHGADIPADFWVPTLAQFEAWRGEGDAIKGLLGI